MNRKYLALILALVAVAVAVVLAVGGRTPGGDPDRGTQDTRPSIPGVADSIFDPVPDDTADPNAEHTEPVTQPDNTIPDGPADSDTDPQQPEDDVPDVTRPAQTEPAATQPQQTEPTAPVVTEPTIPATTEPVQVPDGEIDYETFAAMSPTEQRVYMESFESMDAFFTWYNAAKEAYEKAHPSIDVGDGVIDLEDLFG